MAALRIVVLEGDQKGQELLEHSLRLLDPNLVGIEVELDRYDLSLEHRRKTKTAVCTARPDRWRAQGRPARAPDRGWGEG